MIDDWRPLGESLEWALGRRYWDRRGLSAFVEDGVPFMVNADGVAADAWAELLLQQLERSGRTPAEGASVLEIGVGSGLFARHLLRAVARRSPSWAEALTFVAADASPRMLEDIARRDVLEPFVRNCRLVVHEAGGDPAGLADAAPTRGYDAVFLNYVLDTLPFTAVRVKTEGLPTEIQVRTVLAAAGDPEPLRPLAADREPESLDHLLRVRDDLRMEFREVAWNGALGAEAAGEPGVRLLHHGAAACLDACIGLLAHGGFVALRDYAFSETADGETAPLFQGFAGSTAVGLDFRYLEALIAARGWAAAAPEEDDEDIRTRLIAPTVSSPTAAAFRRLFGKAATDPAKLLTARARTLANAGCTTAALDTYRRLLEQRPDHWGLHSEAARLLNKVGDHHAAAAVARDGLEANPISPELMNDLGDALFFAGAVDEAHRWFAAAFELAPAAAQGPFNLTYTHARRGEYADALAAIATALAVDTAGAFRERLLARQSELLAEMDREWRRQDAKAQDRRGPWRNVTTGA